MAYEIKKNWAWKMRNDLCWGGYNGKQYLPRSLQTRFTDEDIVRQTDKAMLVTLSYYQKDATEWNFWIPKACINVLIMEEEGEEDSVVEVIDLRTYEMMRENLSKPSRYTGSYLAVNDAEMWS